MIDWFHLILEHLYYNYPLDNNLVEMNDFFKKQFNIQIEDTSGLTMLRKIIDSLKDKGYILSSFESFDNKVTPILGASNGNYIGNIDTVKISLKLTLEGYDYITKWEREKKLYKVAIKTNKWFYLTIAIAVIGAITSIGNLAININSKNEKSSQQTQYTFKQQKKDTIINFREHHK